MGQKHSQENYFSGDKNLYIVVPTLVSKTYLKSQMKILLCPLYCHEWKVYIKEKKIHTIILELHF